VLTYLLALYWECQQLCEQHANLNKTATINPRKRLATAAVIAASKGARILLQQHRVILMIGWHLPDRWPTDLLKVPTCVAHVPTFWL
jgi:hypothetical protein